MTLPLDRPGRTILYSLLGAFTGSVLAAVYLAVHFVSGGVDRPDGSIMSPFVAVTVYILGGMVAGVIFAGLHKFLRKQWTAILLGMVAVTPSVFGIAYVYLGSFSAPGDLAGVVIIALGIGASVGFAANQEYNRPL